MLKRRSVYAPKTRADGLRILTTRFRGRGLPKNRYHVWMASLGPSEDLFTAFRSGGISWAQFKRKYLQEMRHDGLVDRNNKTIKNHGQKFTLRLIKELARTVPVTLMCHCSDDEPECHTRVLMALLRSPRI